MISFLLSVPQYVRFVLLVIYVGCIVALSLLPPQDLPQVELFYGADKLIHLMMYFIFAMLGCWALKAEENRARIFLIILVTVGWGIFMEFMQLEMHAGRSFSWYDELANATGVLTGILFYLLTSNNTVKG
ncbi:MAG: VanZ family protein [Methylococcaceae bacterium]|nr:VanZ family protein [Prolixibacteraceae bacterium]